MIYLVIDQRNDLIPFKEMYQLFDDKEKAQKFLISIGWELHPCCEISDKPGHMVFQQQGLSKISVIGIEVQ